MLTYSTHSCSLSPRGGGALEVRSPQRESEGDVVLLGNEKTMIEISRDEVYKKVHGKVCLL